MKHTDIVHTNPDPFAPSPKAPPALTPSEEAAQQAVRDAWAARDRERIEKDAAHYKPGPNHK